MPTKRCSWGTCNSDSRYSHKDWMKDVSFLPFPKPAIDLERCRLWIKQCGRPHSDLSVDKIRPHHFVCSKHFIDGSKDPVAAKYPSASTPKARSDRKRPAESLPVTPKMKQKHADQPLDLPGVQTENISDTVITLPMFHDILDSNPSCNSENYLCCEENVNVNDQNNNVTSDNTSICASKDKFFVDNVTENDKDCFYYTGVPTLVLLHFLFSWIKPSAQKIKLWDGKRKHLPGRKGGRQNRKLSVFHEMILTLVKIRRGYGNKHLSYLFHVSESHVCRIFLAWVNLLSQCLTPLIIWPSKEINKANLPKSFSNYPRTRAIIDCTEYYVQKPLRPAAQKATWSSYKHSNTLKQLIAITPSGAISFLSDVYSGSISDAAIVRESKFVDLVEETDDIMADRGFNIRHLLLPKKATLNIPAFTHGKVLSSKALKRSRGIAKVRIHVERAICRMKTFKILSGIIPLKFRFILFQITKIVAVLCNLQPCLAQ